MRHEKPSIVPQKHPIPTLNVDMGKNNVYSNCRFDFVVYEADESGGGGVIGWGTLFLILAICGAMAGLMYVIYLFIQMMQYFFEWVSENRLYIAATFGVLFVITFIIVYCYNQMFDSYEEDVLL